MSSQKIILIICLALQCHFLVGQNSAPGIQWQRYFTGIGGHSLAHAVVKQTNEGGFIVCGEATLIKLNGNGNTEWRKQIPAETEGYGYEFRSICQTSDGGYIVAGSIQTPSDPRDQTLYYDWVIAKLSAAGEIEWRKILGGSGDSDVANSIEQTSDGGYIVAGSISSITGDIPGLHGAVDYWVIKLNGSGDIVWQKCLGGSQVDDASSIRQTPDGGFIVAGSSNSSDGDVVGLHSTNYDYWIVKLNNTGDIEWQKCLGGNGFSNATCIDLTSDGGYIVSGGTYAVDGDVTGNHGDIDVWIVKLSITGNKEWQKCLGGVNIDVATSIQQTSGGSYIVSGTTNSGDGDVINNHRAGVFDSWIIKLSDTGGIEWQKCLGGTSTDVGMNIVQTADGGYITAVQTNSVDGDLADSAGGRLNGLWIVKLGNNPLPLTLTGFTAFKQNETVLLGWQTSMEINTKGFEVERSQNAVDFEVVAIVPAAGNSVGIKNYAYTDLKPFYGINYYRLKQSDMNGNVVFSKTASVNFSKKGAVVYPNPAGSSVTVIPVEKLRSITIFNSSGKMIRSIQPHAGNQYNIADLPTGFYLFKLLYQTNTEVIKFSKQ